MIQAVTFLSPIVGGHQQPLKGSRKLTIPKKVTIAELPGVFSKTKITQKPYSNRPLLNLTLDFAQPKTEPPSGLVTSPCSFFTSQKNSMDV